MPAETEMPSPPAFDINLAEEEEKSMAMEEKKTLTVNGYTGYEVKVEHIAEDTISVLLGSTRITIRAGETKAVELNKKGTTELHVRLNSIIDGVPELTFRRAAEPQAGGKIRVVPTSINIMQGKTTTEEIAITNYYNETKKVYVYFMHLEKVTELRKAGYEIPPNMTARLTVLFNATTEHAGSIAVITGEERTAIAVRVHTAIEMPDIRVSAPRTAKAGENTTATADFTVVPAERPSPQGIAAIALVAALAIVLYTLAKRRKGKKRAKMGLRRGAKARKRQQ
jgi:hypothetical protein